MRNSNIILSCIAVVLICLTLSCHEDNGECLEDLGNVVAETRTVMPFKRLVFDGVGQLFLMQGSPETVRIEANERLLDILRTEVDGEELNIRLTECVQGENYQLDLFLTVPDIEDLVLNGVGDLRAVNFLELDELSVVLNGVGNVDLQGRVDYLQITGNGVGNVKAFDLEATSCEVVVTGAGNVEVTVTDFLDVTINGVSNVHYRGSPDITVSINGVGSLIDAN